MDVYAEHNEFIICPYNESHRVQRGTRFQRHLIECRKNYPDVEEQVCPYNFTHRVKKPELKYHLTICPDADVAKRFSIRVNKEQKYNVVSLGVTTEPTSICTAANDENWDDDLPARPVEIDKRGWDPNLMFMNPDRLSGLKPREKREIRLRFGRGETLEDIKNCQEEKIKLNKVAGDELKLLPPPKLDTFSAEVYRPMGRGGPLPDNTSSTVHTGRIAANIFPESAYPTLNPLVPNNNFHPMGRGISQTVRPPPGLGNPRAVAAPVIKTFGRGTQVKNVGKAPPGFGCLIGTDDKSKKDLDNNSKSTKKHLDNNSKSTKKHLDNNSKSTKKDLDNNSNGLESLMKDLRAMSLASDSGSTDSTEAKPNRDEKAEKAEKEKRARRLEKKLKQIEHLKNKKQNGAKLNDEEETKIEGEAKIREELEQLTH